MYILMYIYININVEHIILHFIYIKKSQFKNNYL